MHYKIKGEIIRSENAAKPACQANMYLVQLISSIPRCSTALDFGCGKLRYSHHLEIKCDALTIVDSKEQLLRSQTIHGQITTIQEYVSKYLRKTTVVQLDEFLRSSSKFDYILCANVLSAIPIKSKVLSTLVGLKLKLNASGVLLIVCQYRNSYFRTAQESERHIPFGYGWMMLSKKGASYYGIIDPQLVRGLASKAGLVVKKLTLHDGSLYAFCGRAD